MQESLNFFFSLVIDLTAPTRFDVISAPLKTSETLYSQFQVKDSSPAAAAGDSQSKGNEASKKASDGQHKKSQSKRKKDGDKKKDKMITLESALKTLDATEIKAQLTDVKNRCPDAPSVS